MRFSLRLLQGFLAFWIVLVAVAYITGSSPAYALVGVIFAATNIVMYYAIKRSARL